ncbi:tellurite resistance TerB family protein [uncultured Thiodictyon sp.]|uniref:tellurite resistance TerB family protein n=1 Tax=uncultured Thiodictyon sp. TaxID=1846217 RepID=UPI0025DFEA1E|nr:tellurite resistance TerB family protein [uncultured Thiodictyon sp.]
MANLSELVGTFIQNAMGQSGGQRVGNVLQDLQANIGNMVDRQGGASGILNTVLETAKTTLGNAATNPTQAAGLGAVLGSVLGGGGSSVSGAVKGGALALLAGVAYKALTSAGQGAEGGAAPAFSGGAVPVAMTAAPTPADHQVLANTAELVIRGMINAAKADGEVTADEIIRIVGKLKEAGMDGDAEAWIMKELRQPLDLDAFAAAIPNQEVAAQVYAASLLAIEVDTPQEQAYLADLAKKTGLDAAVVQNIQQTLGVKV